MHGDQQTVRTLDLAHMSVANVEEFRNYVDGAWTRCATSGRTGLEFYTQIKTVYQGC